MADEIAEWSEDWKGARKRTPQNSRFVSFRIPMRLYNRLVEFTGEHDTTQAAVFREALKEFMGRHRRRGRKSKTANSLFD